MHTGALSSPPPSGITYVGTCDNGGSSVTTIACTYAGVPSGAIIAIGVSGASRAISVADSVNGAAIQVGSNLSYNSGSSIGNIWYGHLLGCDKLHATKDHGLLGGKRDDSA